MKIDELISKEKLKEYEDFSYLASRALSDPSSDELGRQNNVAVHPGPSRKPVISLKHIHKLKLIQAAKREEFEKRKLLMGVMYAIPEKEE